MVGQKYFKEKRAQTSVWGEKYTKYNKINNNSENFSGEKLLPGGGSLPWTLFAGLNKSCM